jgi:hypothetical protein
MNIVGSFLFWIVAFIIIAILITKYMRWVTNIALSDYFREAETIVDGGIPDKWIVQINRRLAINWLTSIFRREPSGTDLVMLKIDRLIRFFENSQFFESDDARELLLSQLQETRERWSIMSWEEIS